MLVSSDGASQYDTQWQLWQRFPLPYQMALLLLIREYFMRINAWEQNELCM